jgi:SIR2-like domain
VPQRELDDLRRNLSDALRNAERLSDEPRPAEGRGYFVGDDLEHAVDQIARSRDPLTLIAGAGVSMEAGMPSWLGLVRRLVERVAGGLEPVQRQGWVDAVMKEGPLAAAAVAESAYMDSDFKVDTVKWRARVREALYGGSPSSFPPGALASQIALLKKRFPEDIEILTANYDGLLETALEQVLGDEDRDVVSCVRGVAEPPGAAAVWHIHGRLMLRPKSTSHWRTTGRLVLSEASYADVPRGEFPENFMSRHVRDRLCVFVGLSLTDPNLIRWLYRYGDPRYQHIAIFVRQGSPAYDREVRERLERANRDRWRRCGVRTYFAEYYGEVAQLLHEAGLRRAGADVPALRERASMRRDKALSALVPSDPAQFAIAQQKASKWLRDRLDDVREIAAASRCGVEGEQLGLAIWGADHERGQLMLWAAHDRVFSSEAALESRPLERDSRWVAVAAVTTGASVEQDPAVYTSRWRMIRAIPIVVADAGGDCRTISGALTLTSTTALEQSRLGSAKAAPGLLHELDQFLGERAAKWFV